MGEELLGDDFKLYWDSASDYDSPTWALQTSVGDLGFDPQNEQVPIPKRKAFKYYKKGRGDWTLSFQTNIDKSNAFHNAVRAAIDNGTAIHLAIADGPIATAGTEYHHAWWFLTGPTDGSLDTNANIEVEGKIHHDDGEYGDEDPAAVTVGA